LGAGVRTSYSSSSFSFSPSLFFFFSFSFWHFYFYILPSSAPFCSFPSQSRQQETLNKNMNILTKFWKKKFSFFFFFF
jgi:hypothetical protein